jgi:hypothetical protein
MRRFWRELREIAQVLAGMALLLMLALYIQAIERENQQLRQMYIDLRRDVIAGKVK